MDLGFWADGHLARNPTGHISEQLDESAGSSRSFKIRFWTKPFLKRSRTSSNQRGDCGDSTLSNQVLSSTGARGLITRATQLPSRSVMGYSFSNSTSLKCCLLSTKAIDRLEKIYICLLIYLLPVVLYGCGTWYLTLREERRLRVFETGSWGKYLCPRGMRMGSGEGYTAWAS